MDTGKSTSLQDVCRVLTSITTANDIGDLADIVDNDIRRLIPYNRALYVLAKRDDLRVVKSILHNYTWSELESFVKNEEIIRKKFILNSFEAKEEYSNILATSSYGFHERYGKYVSLFICSSTKEKGHMDYKNVLDLIIPRMHSTFAKLYHSMMLISNRPTKPLSPRESEILTWISKGKTNHEIGIILSISTYTVKNHVSNILEKLNAANRAEASIKASMY